MSLILLLSILVRLVALVWSLHLLRRTRDWRLLYLSGMLILMASRQLLTFGSRPHDSWTIRAFADLSELPGLVVSVMAFLVVVSFIQRVEPPKQTFPPSSSSWTGRRLSLWGLAIGGISVLCCFVVGWLAFFFSREILVEAVGQDGPDVALVASTPWLVGLGVVGGILIPVALGVLYFCYYRAEMELRESEARYFDLYENAPDMFCSVDVQTRCIVRCNRTVAERLGYSKDEILGHDLFDLYHPDSHSLVQEKFEQFRREGRVHNAELALRHKDGSPVEVSLNVSGIYDEQGNLVASRSIWRDIGEQKKMERENARLAEILQATTDFVGMATPDYRSFYVNKAGRRLVGLGEEEDITRMVVTDYSPPRLDGFYENEVLPLAIRDGSWTGESIFLHRDGREVPVSQVVLPHFDSNGEIQMFSTVARDITPAKELEAELRESQQRYHQLFENYLNGFALLEAIEDDSGEIVDFRIIEMNPASKSVTGIDPEHFIGLTMVQFDPDFQSFGGWDVLTGVARTGIARELEFFYRPLEKVLHISYYCVRLGLVGCVYEDVTDRHRAEAERTHLIEELQAKEQTLAHVTRQLIDVQETERRHLARELHDEIGQVLSSIGLSAKRLRKDATDEQLVFVEDIVRSVTKLIEQVRNLSLDLRPAMLDDFGLASALRWFVDNRQPRMESQLHLDIRTSGVFRSNRLDNACFRVVQESLTNVAKYAQAKNVWIELVESDESRMIRVRDDGIGFDVVAAQKKALQGKSLGILGMKERIELLGGKFEIESSQGAGTSLELSISNEVDDDDSDDEESDDPGSVG